MAGSARAGRAETFCLWLLTEGEELAQWTFLPGRGTLRRKGSFPTTELHPDNGLNTALPVTKLELYVMIIGSL